MKKTYVLALAMMVAGLWCGNLTANAKVKQLKLHVNSVEEGQTVISGKTTPKAKVKVSRYKYTYAVGKANKNGNFTLYSKDVWSGNWSYRVMASKKGYRTIKRYVIAKPVTETNIEPTIKVQNINDINNRQATTEVNNGSDSDKNAVDQQIAQLKSELNNLQNQLNNKVDNSSPRLLSVVSPEEKKLHEELLSKVTPLNEQRSKNFKEINSLELDIHKMQRNLDNAARFNNSWVENEKRSIEYNKSQIKKIENDILKDPNNQTLIYNKSQYNDYIKSEQDEIDTLTNAHKIVGDNLMDYQKKIQEKQQKVNDLKVENKELDSKISELNHHLDDE
ncbi:hypothetical protein LASUN_01400 [Lentilactobacillus sunkii]|uniref:Bacterial Ig domain-containing protein n=1 Tax=Lentilactobacillus sunkii TaxID=481719 RepID=A0A1E7XJ66_9LACO|nr:hypothetical protein [Lentilactobacillus sunkii]OFA13141.1 hypothetical protein LASUN_01400 [Lentilactobacillus sunkii]